jgi:hypothetical protein
MLMVKPKDPADLKRRENGVFVELVEYALPYAITITTIIIIAFLRGGLASPSSSQKQQLLFFAVAFAF